MIAYASRTGTRRNLQALRKAGWRLLVSAAGAHSAAGMPYGLDNGAWSAYRQRSPFDHRAFARLVDRLGQGADWVVAPDIVCGGAASLALSLSHVDGLLKRCQRVLLAAQDGMTAEDFAPYVGPRVGVAIGGSTAWKEACLARRTFSSLPCHLHVLRVNTARRIALCHHASADSFDGSSVTRFAKSLPRLERARRQLGLFSRRA